MREKSLIEGFYPQNRPSLRDFIRIFAENLQTMETIYQNFEEHLRKTDLNFKRYLYSKINWGYEQ